MIYSQLATDFGKHCTLECEHTKRKTATGAGSRIAANFSKKQRRVDPNSGQHKQRKNVVRTEYPHSRFNTNSCVHISTYTNKMHARAPLSLYICTHTFTFIIICKILYV